MLSLITVIQGMRLRNRSRNKGGMKGRERSETGGREGSKVVRSKGINETR